MDQDVSRRGFLKGGGAAAGALGAATVAGVREASAQSMPAGSQTLTTRMTLNGVTRSAMHEARVSLLDLLRE